jgi:cyanophycinase
MLIPLTSFQSCALKGSRDSFRSTRLLSKSDSYEIYLSGSSSGVTRKTTSSFLLAGGGTDREDAMRWFVRQSGSGDIVILRESGGNGYNAYLLDFGANSVTSIVIKSREASNNTEIIDRINGAEGIFFAGGDQSNYAKFIANTPLANAVNAAIRRGVPVGGTSAGLAILGEFYFPAYNDTITSKACLANPFDEGLVLDRDLLAIPILKGLITDSHFQNRDRIGRLVTFMARVIQDGWASEIRGVGLDEEVALVIESNGDAKVFADNGSAYLLEANSPPRVCESGKPLTYPRVIVRKVKGGNRFNFNRWPDMDHNAYILTVQSGIVSAEGHPIY